MAIIKQKGLSKVGRIKVKKEGDKKQEIVVLHKTLIQKDEGSVWRWLEEFTTEWSETFIIKKGKRPPTP